MSSCKCYSRLVNVCHAFVPSRIRYFCHANVFHAHACHAIVGHAIVTSCKCFSCKRDHVNVLHTSASSRVPRWLPFFVEGHIQENHFKQLSWLEDISKDCVWNILFLSNLKAFPPPHSGPTLDPEAIKLESPCSAHAERIIDQSIYQGKDLYQRFCYSQSVCEINFVYSINFSVLSFWSRQQGNNHIK